MDLPRYLGLFVTDAREQLARLESDLVRFDQTPGDEDRVLLLDAVFRDLHSIKGAAAAMGFDPIARTGHAAEQLMADARRRGRLSPAEVDLLLEAADGLRRLLDDAAAKRPFTVDEPLLVRLEGTRNDRAPASGSPIAASAPATVDAPHTTVRVTVSPRCAAPAARAFVVLRRLEAVAEILNCAPSREVLREGSLPERAITVVLKGVHGLDPLRRAIARVPDVESLEIVLDARPAPVRAAPRPAFVGAAPADQTIRVKVDLLDQLLELAGELVLSSSRLRETSRRLSAREKHPLEDEVDKLGRLVKDLSTRVLATRQTPVQLLTDRLPRVVRDLSRRLDKPLRLVIEGGDITLDRGLLDALADPITHAVRNAVDHGIEPPAIRRQLGKPAVGTLTISARRERERVILELADDGAGFDVAGLRERALRAGAITGAEAVAMTDDESLRLAFLPGLSTRDTSSDISGRGVGMDAVLVAIEQLGGRVTLHSTLGVGSSVLFSLPMALSVTNLLLVDVGGETLGMPMSKVLFAAEGDLSQAGPEGSAARVLQLGDEHILAYSLDRLIGFPEASRGHRPFVVVEGEGQRAAVGVDRLIGQEEVVMRPLSPPLERIRGLAGTAILGSGRPIFVLDVPRLVA